ncbi:MAG: putative heme-binding protein [Verrucomicrobiales bacterium]|nr:putative heme-binding protein [Verrucomicrobiales bacterium]
MRFAFPLVFLAIFMAFASEVRPVDRDASWRDERWNKTDLGQFVSSSIQQSNLTVVKALSIKVGDNNEAAVCYDMAACAMRLAWTGSFLHFVPTKYGVVTPPEIAGTVTYHVSQPEPWNFPVRYRGFSLSGKRVVLSYNVLAASVLESPWFETNSTASAFVRSFEIEPSERPLNLIIVTVPTNSHPLIRTVGTSQIAYYEDNGQLFAAMATGNPEVKLGVSENHFVLTFGPHSGVQRSKLFFTSCKADDLNAFAALVNASKAPEDLKALSRPGPAHWKTIETVGQVAPPSNEPYVVDTIAVPYDNPDKALMFITGLDFLGNGDAVVCTVHGDVWTVSGIDDTLKNIRWHRFATGLYQPLGVKVVRNQIYVVGRDRITRLRDLNGDGEADSYENFYGGIDTLAERHKFVACLETDAQGNFYYVDEIALHRVSSDGQTGTAIAAGFRNPNGMSVSPTGVITVSPQQGEWTPASVICEIKPNGWYGFGGPKTTPERPLGYDQPLCWIPHSVDNSSGGQVWVTSDKWGPLKDQLLHLSYGKCEMMLTLREVVAGVAQGGVFVMKPNFLSGAMRGTFRKQDGQIYVAGSLGWETKAVKDGSLQRVRYTGQNVYLPTQLHAYSNGIELGFTQALDRSTAEDTGSYSIEQWNYHYQKKYGSKDYLTDKPDTEGHDTVNVTSAKLLPDGHSVFLQIDNLKPVMQMNIKFNVNAADGKIMRGDIYNTINKLGASKPF